ncbi:hypothetical protein IQ241_15520 [Romeria aff. gracilis LEGE 07310]|uniref:Uncharacterized protein n=1 Tax=Vasconcelosia minhoensis LEGE 07310 TaxID=915328 RepID=A0A8J7AGE9_9CYAN|nr:hypothetical protein [Romeria gracilis]MBE9078686.1 hypothetical protein [Romeria aff. gracilis LEGE 07310]
MQRLQWGLLLAVGAFSLTGCSFFSSSGETTVVAPLPTEAPAQAEMETPASDAVFTDPAAETPQTALTAAAPDLIRSTDPDERARQVQRSRPDPFASLAITPPVPIIPLPEDGGTASRPSIPGSLPGGSSASSGGSSAGSGQSRPSPSRTAAAPQPAATLAAKPPAPQPTTARTVSVSGVVRIDGTAYAIVRVPNEPERYVRQGDRIANNRVLVKRIDTQSAEPKIVLEENGVEVAMGISEAAVATGNQSVEGPAAQLPVVPSLATLPVLNDQ